LKQGQSKTTQRILEDEEEGGAIGMLLFSAAAGVKDPIHELELDCQGSIQECGDIVTLSVGEIKSSKKALKKAVEQLDSRLLVLEAAMQAVQENHDLVCRKVAFFFLPKSSRYLKSEEIPQSSIGAKLITVYL
jgi:hypothetical protein